MAVIRLLPPHDLAPDALCILLHGVGADAASMQPLGMLLQSACPTMAVVIPDAPERSDISSFGWQWFSVRGVTDQNRASRIDNALTPLKAFIASEQARYALAPARTAVGGFSQGAMMALALADHDLAPSAIAAIAGRIARPVAAATGSSPTILLSHGALDPVVPFPCMEEAEHAFLSAGYPVKAIAITDLGHSISPAQAMALSAHFAAAFATTSLEAVA